MLTLKPSSIRPPCGVHPHAPCHVAGCYLTYSCPCHPALPPDGSVSVNRHHGRSGSGAQQARALSVVVEKQPSCKRPFVSFQNYLRVYKADRCCVYLVVYHPAFSSPELLFWEMPLVWDLTAGGMCSHREVSLMPCCNITPLIATYRGYRLFSSKSDRKCNWNVHLMEAFIPPAVTKVYDLQVALSRYMRRRRSKVTSKSQITLCHHTKTHLFHCFAVAASSFLVVRGLGNDPANSHRAARLSCCRQRHLDVGGGTVTQRLKHQHEPQISSNSWQL